MTSQLDRNAASQSEILQASINGNDLTEESYPFAQNLTSDENSVGILTPSKNQEHFNMSYTKL